jgi:hypothetical protein
MSICLLNCKIPSMVSIIFFTQGLILSWLSAFFSSFFLIYFFFSLVSYESISTGQPPSRCAMVYSLVTILLVLTVLSLYIGKLDISIYQGFWSLSFYYISSKLCLNSSSGKRPILRLLFELI